MPNQLPCDDAGQTNFSAIFQPKQNSRRYIIIFHGRADAVMPGGAVRYMTRNKHRRHGQIRKALRIRGTKAVPEIPNFASKRRKRVHPLG